MVSGSKLKNPSKVSGDSPISLYYSLIYGNCLGNVVMGMENVEKCVKMCENALVARFLYTTARLTCFKRRFIKNERAVSTLLNMLKYLVERFIDRATSSAI